MFPYIFHIPRPQRAQIHGEAIAMACLFSRTAGSDPCSKMFQDVPGPPAGRTGVVIEDVTPPADISRVMRSG